MSLKYFIVSSIMLFSYACLSGEELCDSCTDNGIPDSIKKASSFSDELVSNLSFSGVPEGSKLMFNRDIEIYNNPHNYVKAFGIEASGDFNYVPLIKYSRDTKDGDVFCGIISKNVKKISAGDSFAIKKLLNNNEFYSNKPLS